MDWKTLCDRLDNDDHRHIIVRSREVEQSYKKMKETLREQNISLADNIVRKYFSGQSASLTYKIVPNNFPYMLDSTITHLVGWVNPTATNTDGWQADLLNILRHTHGEQFENDMIRWNVNKVENMSIPTIKHMHIFIRSNESEST